MMRGASPRSTWTTRSTRRPADSPTIKKRASSAEWSGSSKTRASESRGIALTLWALGFAYGIRPFRRQRQKPTTVCLLAPAGFVSGVLWPQHQEETFVITRARAQLVSDVLTTWLGADALKDPRAEIHPQSPILPLAGSGPPADSSPILLAAVFGPESSPAEPRRTPLASRFK